MDAVRVACTMCQKIQAGCGCLEALGCASVLIASCRRSIMVQEEEGLDTKKDRSLVTTADYATQALISGYVFAIAHAVRLR